MVQLRVLAGSRAGSRVVARRFPFRVGRASTADLCLPDAGVWDEHAVLALDATRGFVLRAQGAALLHHNGRPVSEAILRNGDQLELGSARLQFWLDDAHQRGLRGRELAVWVLVGLITLAQVALLYALLR